LMTAAAGLRSSPSGSSSRRARWRTASSTHPPLRRCFGDGVSPRSWGSDRSSCTRPRRSRR
jgi:hypothetical protein